MAEFRHPSAIRQELSRFMNIRHRIAEALQVPALDPENAQVGERSKLFTAGVIAALEWALCSRKEIEPGETTDDSPSDVPRDPLD